MYARVINNAITQTGLLPNSARRLDNDNWVMGLATASVTDQRATGWYAVVDTPMPTPPANKTYDRSVTLVNSIPTVTWTQRDMTAAEIANATAAANEATLRAQADAALATNTTALSLPDPTPGNNTYLAIASPSTAQVTAQVRALTQQNNALRAQVTALTQQNNKIIRLLINKLDGTT